MNTAAGWPRLRPSLSSTDATPSVISARSTLAWSRRGRTASRALPASSSLSAASTPPLLRPTWTSVLRRARYPDVFAYNTVVRGFFRAASPAQSLLFFSRDMLACSIRTNALTFPFLLKACSQLGDLMQGRKLHAHLHKLGFGDDLHIVTALISVYTACGDARSARRVFEQGSHENSIWLWNALISGFVKCGRGLELFYELLWRTGEAEMVPNEITVVSALAACADIDALDVGKWIHEYSSRLRIRVNVYVASSLINMYAKCECIDMAERLFDEMPERNVALWTAMIKGLAMSGHGKDALVLFSEMVSEDIVPDDAIFVGVLSACAHAGLADEGRRMLSCSS